ncbi:Zinc finger FYVE-related protein [Penicillium citrinum]|uniref:Zinc finger FYVE-related protein n=2 Tax=Penicillium TaxID=5073 RepID=A0A9W9PBS7_PENCI|nr:Zinc finger FYVE-related protein [Penicillium citrinum]KAJ5241623.1 Zinc finger FYVE-related protein [Penicillium citrinum]KAJ5586632.1 Zinc finger FYVE-related protein [Penicillium hetheringtonii]
MATHVVTAPANQISVYGHPSPTNSSTTTPSNNSPTSPRLTTAALHQLPLQSRQLRPPKGPLYVPAALRPTERPQKSSPITPPRSVHGSLDSLNEDAEPISRRSTMESKSSGISKSAEHEWMKNESLGEVTGHPTRDHWKADSASPNCDSPTCRSSFGLFLRRHHCRHCGHVFCSSHTPHMVPLDQDARFHPEGVSSRACDLCWSAYQRWEETRTNRLSKIQDSIDKNGEGETEHTEDLSASEEMNGATLKANLGQTAEIAASVPRDWNWSTF